MTEEKTDPGEVISPGDGLRGANRLAWIITAAALAVFVAAVIGYGSIGGTFVHGLEEQNAEVQRTNGRRLAAAGENTAAITYYERAVRLPWDDPRQRFWTLRELARLYQAEDRREDAVNTLFQSVAIFPERGDVWRELAAMLPADSHTEETLVVATAWFAAMEAAADSDGMARAKYLEGRTCLAVGRVDEAAAALEKSHALQKTPHAALDAARAYIALSDTARARGYLNEVIQTGDPDQAEQARRLLTTLPDDAGQGQASGGDARAHR